MHDASHEGAIGGELVPKSIVFCSLELLWRANPLMLKLSACLAGINAPAPAKASQHAQHGCLTKHLNVARQLRAVNVLLAYAEDAHKVQKSTKKSRRAMIKDGGASRVPER